MADHLDRRPDAGDPPGSVVNERVRRAALRTYLTPIVIFFLLTGAALFYFWNRAPTAGDPAPHIEGTTGRAPHDDKSSPGGFDPQPAPDDAQDEIRLRGGSLVTSLDELTAGEGRNRSGSAVELSNVEVERIDGPSALWVRDGRARVAVVAPGGFVAEVGQRVDIRGTAERDGDRMRIRASAITTRER